MKTITKEELDSILNKHAKWLAHDEGGERANLREVDLSGAALREVDLSCANLYAAKLRGADLRRANLYAADCSEADFSHARMSGVNLHRVNFQRAVLLCTDLNDTNLRYANLSNADIRYAALNNANMRYTNLSHANLSGANLHWANLSHANLSDADLSNAVMGFNAYFASIKGQPIYQCSCGFGSRNATLTLYAKEEPSEWLFFTGCFAGTEDQLRAAVKEQYGDTPHAENYARAIDYLIATANSNLRAATN